MEHFENRNVSLDQLRHNAVGKYRVEHEFPMYSILVPIYEGMRDIELSPVISEIIVKSGAIIQRRYIHFVELFSTENEVHQGVYVNKVFIKGNANTVYRGPGYKLHSGMTYDFKSNSGIVCYFSKKEAIQALPPLSSA